MSFIITVNHSGNEFYLRGTVWTAYSERATVYPDISTGVAALLKAKPFMPLKLFKKAQVIPLKSAF